MASAVGFDDIFDEAAQNLPPMFSTNQNGDTNAHSTLGSTRSIIGSSSTTSYLLTISLATVVLVAVYWVYSFIEDMRRRRRDAFYQLEHRRRHGIPDSDKRPWQEAYPAALERRQPLMRRSPTKQELKSGRSDSAHDPYGRTIKDHLTIEANARYERQKYQELLQQQTERPASPTKAGFFPGPLTLARAQSTLPETESGKGGQTQINTKRAVSPEKSFVASSSAIPRLASLKDQAKTGASTALSSNESAAKMNGRKRLYMDPRDDGVTNGHSGTEKIDDDRAAAFSLPKRQRVNTWGADTTSTNGSQTIKSEKRPLESEDANRNNKRQRAGGKTASVTSQRGALGVNANGVIPIGRISRPGKNSSHVTFAPTPPGTSSDSSSAPPPPQPSRGLKRDREETESVATGDQENSGTRIISTGQPVRKRGREAAASEASITVEAPKLQQLSSEEMIAKFVEDPLCIGRKPGEIWESGRMRFKIGTDGRRLIAGNVKERRPRYTMPADSAHHDNVAMMDVVVEKWFTQEEYSAAKEAGEFSWQDSPAQSESGTPTRKKVARASSSFWDMPDSAEVSPSDSAGEINPFARTSHLGPLRARTSLGSPSPAPLGRSSGGRRAPSTRWQKQQAEAEALKRFQEAKLAQEKSKQAPASSTASSTASATTSSLSVAPPSTSNSTLSFPATSFGSKPADNPFAASGPSTSVLSSDAKDTAPKSTSVPSFFGAENSKSDEPKGVSTSSPASKPTLFPFIATPHTAQTTDAIPKTTALPSFTAPPTISEAPKPSAFPSFNVPSAAAAAMTNGDTSAKVNPFGSFPSSSTAASTPSAGASKPTPPAPSLFGAAPTSTNGSATTTPSLFGGFSSSAAPKMSADAATTSAPSNSFGGLGATQSNAFAPSFGTGASTAASGNGVTSAPTPTASTPAATPTFGAGAFGGFGAQATKPTETNGTMPSVTPTTTFGAPAPSLFAFGTEVKRTPSNETAASTGPAGTSWGSGTAVGSGTFGGKPAEAPKNETNAQPAGGQSTFGGFGAKTPATSAFGTGSGASAFGGGTPTFGAAASPFGATTQTNPFGAASTSAFSTKQPDASQGAGISLKGSAVGFGNGNGSTSFSVGNGAGAFGSQNKKWTNPDLAKKEEPKTNGATTGAFGTTPNAFQTGSADAAKSSVFGASKPSMFGTGQPTNMFGSAAAGSASGSPAPDGGAPTPSVWQPPAGGNIFSTPSSPLPQSPSFPAHRPPGVPANGVRARSRSSRPPTRPPR